MIKPIAFAAALVAAFPAFADEQVLTVGQVKVLHPGAKISTVVVGNPDVTEVVTEGETTVLVLARKVGESDLVLLDEDKHVYDRLHFVVTGTSISDQVTIRRGSKGGVAEERVNCGAAGCSKADAK